MADFYMGQIILFAGNFAPVGWKYCDGSLLPISGFDALFSILGTTYGGDGQTTFGLPDLRGCVPVSAGQGPGRSNYTLGQTSGSESLTLTAAQMPAHTHPVTTSMALNASAKAATATSPKDAVLAAQPAAAGYMAALDGSAVTLSARAVTSAVAIGAAGSSLPVPILMPFTAIGYCICVEGIFPPHS